MKSTTQKNTKEPKVSKGAGSASAAKQHSSSTAEDMKSEAKKEKLLNKELKISD